MRYAQLFCLFLFANLSALSRGESAGVAGTWQTIDDKTGKPKSVVELFERDNKLFGRVIKIFPRPGKPENPVCRKCPGDLKNQPVLGMEVIRGLVKDGEHWTKGKILDPENGKLYNCKLWLEDGRLQVRGYLLMFYRTQEWLRDSE